MKIWLPDDDTAITVDTAPDGDVTLYEQRFSMVLKPIDPPSGFQKDDDDE